MAPPDLGIEIEGGLGNPRIPSFDAAPDSCWVDVPGADTFPLNRRAWLSALPGRDPNPVDMADVRIFQSSFAEVNRLCVVFAFPESTIQT